MLRIFRRQKARKFSKDNISESFRFKYVCFKDLLASNTELLNLITDIEEKLQDQKIFGMSYVRSQSSRAVFHALRMVKSFEALSDKRYPLLFDVLEKIHLKIREELEKRKEIPMTQLVFPYSQITKETVGLVGGKNANLGEVLNRAKLPIPEGFAITTSAFDSFLAHNDLFDEINKIKMELDPNDPKTVNRVSEEIQRLITSAEIPPELEEAILSTYGEMAKRTDSMDFSPRVAMRSSAIGEDSELSFAGQYLSSLNVSHINFSRPTSTFWQASIPPRPNSTDSTRGLGMKTLPWVLLAFKWWNQKPAG